MKRSPHPMFFRLSLLAGLAMLASVQAQPSAPERAVWFGNLKNGQTVTSPFAVEMKARGLVVEPAGLNVTDGRGHFHIIVNSPLPEAPLPIPKDSLHLHFGKGDSVTTLDLPPGKHVLTLQFAKGDHVPYAPQIAQTIRIRVREAARR